MRKTLAALTLAAGIAVAPGAMAHADTATPTPAPTQQTQQTERDEDHGDWGLWGLLGLLGLGGLLKKPKREVVQERHHDVRTNGSTGTGTTGGANRL